MLDNIHHGQVWEFFCFMSSVCCSFPEKSTWQILFQSSYKYYQLYFHCWSFRLHTTSLVNVLLPLSYPEREFFKAKIGKDFHSIVLPPFFQVGCIFVEHFESAVLDHHLKFSVRCRKGSWSCCHSEPVQQQPVVHQSVEQALLGPSHSVSAHSSFKNKMHFSLRWNIRNSWKSGTH